jgi:hypothetical protein
VFGLKNIRKREELVKKGASNHHSKAIGGFVVVVEA